MTSDAEIESVMFTKSVIKSSAALSYVEAQARMDDRYAILFVLNLSRGLISWPQSVSFWADPKYVLLYSYLEVCSY